jgi:hypothetical protein
MIIGTTIWGRLAALAASLLPVGLSTLLSAAAPPPRRAAGDTAWTFRSSKNDFALTLPSLAWRKSTKKKFLVEFHFAGAGPRMLAAVGSVRKQTLEEFRDTVKTAKVRAEKLATRLSKPTFEEVEDASGDRRILLTVCEKGGGALQYLYVAQSLVWIKEKGLTVQVLFEGQGVMRSGYFQSREKAAFEKAARAIHRSVR